MSEKEFQTVTGVCVEIAQKPGSEWVEFHVDSGGKWPVRLSTKLSPLIELGRAVGQELATWTYSEVESSTINEKSGKPFINRYLEKVEVGGAAAKADGSPQRAPVLGGDKDRLIVRQTALKAASALYGGQGTPSADPDWPLLVIGAAARFEAWCYRDLETPPFE